MDDDDPLGQPSQIANAPMYAAQSRMAQQWMQMHNAAQNTTIIPNSLNQGLGMLGAAGASGFSQSTHTVSVIPIAQVTRAKIDKLIDQLPMRVIVGIAHINFHSQEPMRFEVIYTNMRTLEFFDIDKFPSDEHVARIVLETP